LGVGGGEFLPENRCEMPFLIASWNFHLDAVLDSKGKSAFPYKQETGAFSGSYNKTRFLPAIIARILSFLHMLWLFTSICNHEFDFVEKRFKSFRFAIYRLERNLDNTFRTNLGGYIICFSFAVKCGKDYYTPTSLRTKQQYGTQFCSLRN
jgi:hypothetical protein